MPQIIELEANVAELESRIAGLTILVGDLVLAVGNKAERWIVNDLAKYTGHRLDRLEDKVFEEP